MNKKGDFSWEQIAKLLIVIVFLLILLIMIWLLRDKLFSLFDKLKDILRFG